jgi:hypothetical protein
VGATPARRGVVAPSGTEARAGKIPMAQAETLRHAIKAGLDVDARDEN